MNRLRELVLILSRNLFVVQGQQISVSVLLKNRAENPAVAVVVRKLGVLQFWIQLCHLFEKVQVGPQPTRSRGFGVLAGGSYEFFICWVLLFTRIQEFTIALLIPPGITHIWINKQISLVHVANHALARRNRSGKLMANRMAPLVLGN